MKTTDFVYLLPKELIAKRPIDRRDRSRLLVLQRDSGIEHKKFYDLPSFLDPGDMLLINNSKVFPARLVGYKPTGGKLEFLLVHEISAGLWKILAKEKYTGNIILSEELTVQITEGKTAFFENNTDVMRFAWEKGKMPLPPYIRRLPDENDRDRYQTVYAETEGSIAAPTAGLHFTSELIDILISKSVLVRSITLHVGTGTFRPIKALNLEDHAMEEEFFEIRQDTISEIMKARENGSRIIAVGTTTTRAIEGYFSGRCRVLSENGSIRGSTDMFIYEGYNFCAIDSLITNFHLPCSTPLILTSAFTGRENLFNAYKAAIDMKYRFFSYGDAMLLL